MKLLWFFCIVFFCFSFPLQVGMMSDKPALIPYLILFSIYLIKLTNPKKRKITKSSGAISKFVLLYSLLVLGHFIWQVGFGVIELKEGLRVSFLFLAPVVIYDIFRTNVSLSEIKTIFVAIIVSGFCSGLFFVYDSISKLAFNRLTSYSITAENYVNQKYKLDFRDDSHREPSGRGVLNNRSSGLLETHAVSSTWIALATFAILSLLPNGRSKLRFCIILLSSLMIMIGLNFTSIVSFGLVLFLLEFKMISLFSGEFSKKEVGRILSFCLLFFWGILLVFFSFPEPLLLFFKKNLTFQVSLAFSGTDVIKVSYIQSLFTAGFQKILESVWRFPILLLVGEGFSSFGALKGGDLGYVDTFLRLGGLFSLILIFLLWKIIWNIYLFEKRQGFKDHFEEFRILKFVSFVLLFLALMEMHYSVWHAKSILPILFVALGSYTRFYLALKDGNLPGVLNKFKEN
ncbi:putative membrane protein [Leptospira santarosai str. HAI134]|nr:putative membrane protein [Leptospira santarosai str. HAI134]